MSRHSWGKAIKKLANVVPNSDMPPPEGPIDIELPPDTTEKHQEVNGVPPFLSFIVYEKGLLSLNHLHPPILTHPNIYCIIGGEGYT